MSFACPYRRTFSRKPRERVAHRTNVWQYRLSKATPDASKEKHRMSIDIKPGQVWAWNNSDDTFTTSPDIELGDRASLVAVVDTSADRRTHLTPETIRECAHLVKDADATPAPLDPSKVKAGDTVTLEASGGRRVTAPVSERTLPERTKGTWFLDVFYDDDKPQSFSAVHWTLTEHQPAPEPEPEWRGKFISGATDDGVRVIGFVDEDDDFFGIEEGRRHLRGVLLENLTDVRPLVVIDPAAVGAILDDARNGSPGVYDIYRTAYARLGIEAS